MAHKVKCIYCGQTFDRDKTPCVQVSSRRYAHVNCSANKEDQLSKEEQDKLALEEYIMKLFNTTYIDPRVRKQIKQYVEEYKYSYSGIHKSLTYFYEIKGNSIDKANGGIGIVPYVYQKAYQYYFALWEAQQKNEYKVVEEYIPIVKEIVIPNPQRKIKKRALFTFLDEE